VTQALRAIHRENRDHECVEVCRAKREECRLDSGIDAALDTCRDALRGAKATCRANNPPDSPELDQCIDQAQVVAFQCRRAARAAAKGALKICRQDFRQCARACPPPDPPSETIDRKQCKLDAKGVYLACKKVDCREEYQFQKDVCRNRDHACVEDCRAERDACRQPIEDLLDANKAACNATRDQEIQNCENLYASGTPEREQCIANAQVTAFQCRDQARETAKPDLLGCRDDFRSCAEACPPAS
jgi:hypothetical protein